MKLHLGYIVQVVTSVDRLLTISLVVVIHVVSMSGLLFAQTGGNLASDPLDGWERPVAVAQGVEVPPILDGDVLNDPVWAVAQPVGDFYQTRPDEGNPSSQKTEVRIVFTRDTLYVGVVCYDDDPADIIVTEGRRDSSLSDSDAFEIILDTFLDRQNGFLFATNPAGIEYDAQVNNEGQGGGPQRWGNSPGRSGAGFNLNWDGSWEVSTRITPIGWSAEFSIPFRTLRYPQKEGQTWGLNFKRSIRRRNETTYWAPLSRQYDLVRLSLAGTLSGVETPSQQNLQVTPYVLGEIRERGSLENTQWLGDMGADLKYSLTPSLTLDLTYNTDFAQVEADVQQINLNRFNLFFPEKRPFFLENAGLFTMGSPQEVELFFSRRIGIGPVGEQIPVLGGARLTGKVGGTDVGFLNMQTEEAGDLTQANNYTVARVRRELPNRSSLGAMFTNRQGTGDLAADDDHNRSFAIDGRWGIGQSGQLAGFAARTFTPEVDRGEHAFKFGGTINTPAWRLDSHYTEVGENFNPEMGFLRRRDFRKMDYSIFHFYRPDDLWGLLEIRPHTSFQSFWNLEGLQETARLHAGSHWEWRNGWGAETGMNIIKEVVSNPFEIFPGVEVPIGTYDDTEARWIVNTDMAARLSLRLTFTHGGFFGGDRVGTVTQVKFRLQETFSADLNWEWNDIDLPGGDFVTNLARLRLNYSFSPQMFLQSLIQYNDRDDLWSMNLRFGWIQAANAGLFLVYNDTRGIESMRNR
ncbi:MAG: DUF5916 domain-containing protein, partial [Acidobacteriota bacterium]